MVYLPRQKVAMKVLEKAENACLASMLTPHLTERKYFNGPRFRVISYVSWIVVLDGAKSIHELHELS
jgi:hypothetical protein